MINKFSVRNFRNVNVKDIEFNRINILIGPNNSGKTNFIKALTFFANMIIGGKDKGDYADFYAIIIEDDLDCRFHNKSQAEI